MKFHTPSGFFAFRAPVLPFDELLAWSEAPADRSVLRERLAAIVTRPEVREAIFVASPGLEQSIDLWRRDPDGDRGQRVERALVRYVSRMAGRATPFGLFAGCGIGTIAGETALKLGPRASGRRHTRLDMDYLSSLAAALGGDPERRRRLVYRANSSLYRAGGRWRYVESRIEDKVRSHHLVSVEATEALTSTLERARDGATPDALAAALVDDDVTLQEAEQYVTDLIDGQLLVSSLEVPVTGENPVDVLIADLRSCGDPPAVVDLLGGVRGQLAAFDADGSAVPPERYRAAARSLEALPARVDLDRLFQVDLVRPAQVATLGPAVLDEIQTGLDVLHRLATIRVDDPLHRFCEAFRDRYESREVPLLEALDDETGIGFGSATETSPLLQDVAYPPADAPGQPWTKRDAFMLGKLADALAQASHEIRLTPADIDALAEGSPPPLPIAFAAFASIAAADAGALARGDFRVRLDGASGPSGARLLGRFCYADNALCARVDAHLRAEEAADPGAVFAEIVHLPEGRLGNILYRPSLRSFELAYLGRGGARREHQIPVADLRVSVRGDQIVLRSAALDRRVIPRLTTAHNFAWRSVGVYRFLCALQSQGTVTGLGWNWGPLARAPFLPRIATGRLVLSRAQWLVGKAEIGRFATLAGRPLFEGVRDWRAERRLPRWVVVADEDNTLPVDLDNVLSVESFAHLVKERDDVVLFELFPAPDELCASGPEGAFVHEVVIPFVSTVPARATAERPRTLAAAPSLRRSFPPGSEWLYVKLYSGTATGDDVLREIVAPVTREAAADGTIDRWFFIRYHDPAPHLRLRLHGDATTLQQIVWPSIQAAAGPLIDDGRIWRVVLDTYEREVERYGGPDAIGIAERLFQADSEAVLEIVELLDRGDAGLDERWRLAFHGMDRLLADFGVDLDTRLAMLTSVRSGFAREFRCDKTVDRQLGDRYRKERAALRDLLDGRANGLQPGVDVVAQRSARIRPIAAAFRARERTGALTLPCNEILPSLLHMHANRLLRSVQREQELVLYDFLVRHYESERARVAAAAREERTVAGIKLPA